MSQIGWALPCIYFASGAGSVTAGRLSGLLVLSLGLRCGSRRDPLAL
jgi:hypothetical protein